MALRADLQKTKFTTEMSCLQMLKAMLDALSLWEKVGDNDRDSFIAIVAVAVEASCKVTASVHDEIELLIARWKDRGE